MFIDHRIDIIEIRDVDVLSSLRIIDITNQGNCVIARDG